MTENKMIDLDTVIGVYSLTNTGAVLVHAIDYEEDKILASINAERHRTPAREDKAMTTYKTNHATTTKSMTEWYFGKAFVASMTAKAKRENKKTGKTEFRFWQDGTGYLTIQLH